jgi:hypothetical protein
MHTYSLVSLRNAIQFEVFVTWVCILVVVLSQQLNSEVFMVELGMMLPLAFVIMTELAVAVLLSLVSLSNAIQLEVFV